MNKVNPEIGDVPLNPIRKPFFGDPFFPFDLVYHKKRTPQSELPDHLHDRYELVYVYQGKGKFLIDKTIYEKNTGDLFIIPGNTVHRSFPIDDDPIVSTAVFFAPAWAKSDSLHDTYSSLRCFELAKKQKSYKIQLSDHMIQMTEQAFAQLHQEVTDQLVGYQEAIRLHLGQYLLQLNRYVSQNVRHQSNNSAVGPSWIHDAMLRIDEHLECPLRLSELAERATVHPAHFSRVFKQYTGMNVTDYVNAKRIMRAKELLNTSKNSIAQIAEHCGFDSLPHFYRTFKSLTGVTPGQYHSKQKS